ncbi:hypothetical protein G7K_2932-t1 [Saitoella complicata NRRL Y-17804]|uniref:Uncharacterized protein n=1 Tax=Saitoella complicata (strain BCRC 22490 / CBS 7301 / JCM 7358 / NBRC 10748 / NRRL Y-17804) TaxID=698492 RepID=A0A0E9NG25_SAICN|nr:hypothetical protein G7K_2932-t1 [Saitoella complicata NRRL Y-17804]
MLKLFDVSSCVGVTRTVEGIVKQLVRGHCGGTENGEVDTAKGRPHAILAYLQLSGAFYRRGCSPTIREKLGPHQLSLRRRGRKVEMMPPKGSALEVLDTERFALVLVPPQTYKGLDVPVS